MKNYNSLENKNGWTRRLLAAFCVICMVALQCFVVMPAVTGQAHAAGNLPVGVQYQDENETYAEQSLDPDSISDRASITIVNEEGEEETYEGPTIRGIIDDLGLSTKDTIVVGGYDVSSQNLKKVILVEDGGSYMLFDSNGMIADSVSDIYVKRNSGVKPVSFSKSPTANKTTPSVGDTIKVKYKLRIDTFYKNSNGYDEDAATTLTWSGNSKVKILNKTTSGKSGTVKVKVKKAGSVEVKVKSAAFSELVGVKASFTGIPTTTKYTTRSGGGYTPYRPTTRGGVSGSTAATTPLTTATRPADTDATMAPSFQTITVKEVYLSQPAGDPYSDSGGGQDSQEDDPEQDEEKDYDEDGVTFPSAAGSAAVAAAACGAGAFSRVRRYRADMGPIAAAAAAKEAADGDGRKKHKLKLPDLKRKK